MITDDDNETFIFDNSDISSISTKGFERNTSGNDKRMKMFVEIKHKSHNTNTVLVFYHYDDIRPIDSDIKERISSNRVTEEDRIKLSADFKRRTENVKAKEQDIMRKIYELTFYENK
jgi:hypothetical protein